jgi:FkbM family methyltransferase
MHPDRRVAMTVSCRDCDSIAKVDGAGSITVLSGERVQIMHNGLRVVAGGYHGDWMSRVIAGLDGHHEPQEERIFHHLLQAARPDTLMVELASHWSYYALWYLQEVPNSRALCVEPDPQHVQIGRRNAALNDLARRVRFVEAWVGEHGEAQHAGACESTGERRTLPLLDMEGVLELTGDRRIELLHMDAQGAELGFLRSMPRVRDAFQVRFLMVSTHHCSISGSSSTHEDCLAIVRALGGHVLAQYSVHQSFSGDGLIAASFDTADAALRMPAISRNTAAQSLFPDDAPC